MAVGSARFDSAAAKSNTCARLKDSWVGKKPAVSLTSPAIFSSSMISRALYDFFRLCVRRVAGCVGQLRIVC